MGASGVCTMACNRTSKCWAIRSIVAIDVRRPRNERKPPLTDLLFDNLIGQSQDTDRELDSQRLRCLQVDDEFEMGRLFDRKFTDRSTFDNPRNVVSQSFEKQASVGAIRHESAIARKLSVRGDSRKAMGRQELRDATAELAEQRRTQLHDGLRPILQAERQDAFDPARSRNSSIRRSTDMAFATAVIASLWYGPVFTSHKTAKRCAVGNTSFINCSHLPAMAA